MALLEAVPLSHLLTMNITTKELKAAHPTIQLTSDEKSPTRS